MNTLLLSILFALTFSMNIMGQDAETTNLKTEIPVVQSTETYKVLVKKDIVYADALSHERINSDKSTKIPLYLDVYAPDNDIVNRPLFFFIHGGGFVGGSKQQAQIVNWANYYASRGWVFVSIDYRLKCAYGTVPDEWLAFKEKRLMAKPGRFLAIYPAQRDAKAALRYIVANADTYHINTNYITVGGGSAGAITAVSTGISSQEDFRDEISIQQDPTLVSTNLEHSYQIKTIIDLWGSKIALDALEAIWGHRRFDRNDPSLFIAHGKEDPTVLFSSATDLKEIYEKNGVPYVLYALEGMGHGPWNATVNNKKLEELAFDFIVEQQKLIVEY